MHRLQFAQRWCRSSRLQQMHEAFSNKRTAVVFTSRTEQTFDDSAARLDFGVRVSELLMDVVRGVRAGGSEYVCTRLSLLLIRCHAPASPTPPPRAPLFCLHCAWTGMPGNVGFLISKGGITSNDVLSTGLALKTSRILGQILAGCSVVCTPPDHPQFPNLPVVIFPGNVGGPEGLATAYTRLSGSGA